MDLEEVFDGRTLYTPDGECFEITTYSDMKIPRIQTPIR